MSRFITAPFSSLNKRVVNLCSAWPFRDRCGEYRQEEKVFWQFSSGWAKGMVGDTNDIGHPQAKRDIAGFNEFATAHFQIDEGSSGSSLSALHIPCWVLPSSGVIKINTDASLTSKSSSGGLGFVLWNSYGAVLKAVSIPWSFQEVIVGEALAIREALRVAVAEGFDRITSEIDCEELVN
ncbi:hypothetical protein NE237_021031 [Protea cynaroides]|uniref:RNase H type-1 domain-containing protein n=1 Tax=Protea cynaroides TaxID=273540 RepID=A0A9Q0H9L1_9MAGN|nr:hypothetical protein NE237_021031 [Protea cynaroides]